MRNTTLLITLISTITLSLKTNVENLFAVLQTVLCVYSHEGFGMAIKLHRVVDVMRKETLTAFYMVQRDLYYVNVIYMIFNIKLE